MPAGQAPEWARREAMSRNKKSVHRNRTNRSDRHAGRPRPQRTTVKPEPGRSARLQAALRDPRCPPLNKAMQRTIRTRSGAVVTCRWMATAEGFIDLADGAVFQSPTPLATRFAREIMKQAPGSRRAGFQFLLDTTEVPEGKRVGPRAQRPTARRKVRKANKGTAARVKRPVNSSSPASAEVALEL